MKISAFLRLCVLGGYWDDKGTPGDPSDDIWVNRDYHLQPDSLCINADDPTFVPDAGETDCDGEPRIRLGRVDIGADEAGSHPADLDESVVVDVLDYEILAAAWNGKCDLSGPADGRINLLDVGVFSKAWLWHAPWLGP